MMTGSVKRRIAIFCVALALYAVLMCVAWNIGTYSAESKTEAQLNYAVMDFHNTLAGAIDTMLCHVARTAVRHIGHAHKMSRERMELVAKELDIDEVNVVDRTGLIIASNDPHCMNVLMAGDPVMDAFMKLTNDVDSTISQPFRPHARNPKVRAKYLAAAFPGGDGFVQVGLEEGRLAKMLPSILGYIFDEWLLGRTGFFLCADCDTGRLISNPYRHRNAARTLAETGYDASSAKRFEFIADGCSYGRTFKARLFGENCCCRAFLFGGHRFVAALPMREYYDTRFVLLTVFGSILFVVLLAFALFADRVFRDSDSLKAFYKAEETRIAKDMAIAASIQESAMPRVFPPFPKEMRMDIFASMHTARDVGGDFYDFFFTRPTRFSFLVADVSGKGVPAALFMMRAKATINGISRTGISLDEVVTRANNALSHDNAANMFVTVWIGELDLESGVLKYVNAGHNPPLLIKKADGGHAITPQFVREHSGMMLGAIPGVKYESHTIKLSPGDMIYLYTDGITEQPDANGSLFGEERLVFSLGAMLTAGTKAIDGGSSPLLSAIFDAAIAHGAGAEQMDDCTQLVIRFNGSRQVRSFPPTQKGVTAASEWLDETVKEVPQGGLASLHIILDEICSNIVKHSNATEFEICIEIMDAPHGVRMTFVDDGVPYNPLSHADPDTTLGIDERPIGGLGIMMVKKMASSLSYSHEGGRNRFAVQYAFSREVYRRAAALADRRQGIQ